MLGLSEYLIEHVTVGLLYVKFIFSVAVKFQALQLLVLWIDHLSPVYYSTFVYLVQTNSWFVMWDKGEVSSLFLICF